ncbi:1,4-dihydroxy-2-naphthoate octaprenyltransferase [Aequorivita sp. H23M31]|uniref:1,4-dihydroxy-2-naphthoate octaprenyltransferase n=1 Tax=Aequorivita ciconiae TaxID=2494375 RepID=A0A410FZG0_9FLAO|nr:1,4-dihydroxy-2-naphthoate octaprenyltransferase [Aequorivita sp. H23M31]QAA80389.1 1,4-dihydroxy-2-naphthoate octaprenyltransferase [Aequorivita sp. H23M31]
MTKFKAWISAARLRTLPLSISGIVTAGAAAKEAGIFSTPIFSLALATTLGLQILSNFANDYGDGVKGTDNHERVGPMRAMQSGVLSAIDLKRGIIITSIVTLAIACLLIYIAFENQNIFHSTIFFILGIAAIVAAITYTVGKSAYGYRALGDVFVFLFFGLLGVLGGYFLFAKDLNGYILLPAIVIGLLSTAVLNLNNMRDRLADAKANKITIAVLLGGSKVKIYHFTLIILAFIFSISYFSLKGTTWAEFLPILAFIPLFVHLGKMNNNTSPPLLDPELKKVALSTFLFSILFFVSAWF